VWHSSLTVVQSEALESLQKRALPIIYDDDLLAETQSLETRRKYLTTFFSREVLDTNSSQLFVTADKRRHLEAIDKPRNVKQYELIILDLY